jgi:GNAT superfamily N-acetyltransferase
MTDRTRCQPVPPEAFAEALELLGRSGQGDSAQAGRFAEILVRRDPDSFQFWWALNERAAPVGAVLILERPGRVGLVVMTPVQACPLPMARQAELIALASQRCLAGRVQLVQALAGPDEVETVQVLLRAGFDKLATLRQFETDPDSAGGAADASGQEDAFEWVAYRKEDEARWIRLIRQTYVQTLDCPGLAGMRSGPDILAGHRAAGLFRPDSWWIARLEGQDVGCLLINDVPDASGKEIVYLGLVPSVRGRGLSAVLLARALGWSARQGAQALRVAVDARNTPAIRAYQRAGLAETSRHQVFLRSGRVPNCFTEMERL